MKKILLSLLMAMSAFVASAQNIGEAFYIYRNDGGFNAFFRDEVDSIAYSNYDADSIWYDDVVTQVVYTPDSTYCIPLAAIDSVGFVTPENKYQNDAIVLEGNIRDYIISSDSLTIFFRSDTPSNLLPKIGDKLVTTECSDTFRAGFAGKVESIETEANSIAVHCSLVGLEEVFEYYYSANDIQAMDVKGVRYANGQGDGIWQKEWSPGTIPFKDLTHYLRPNIYPNPTGDVSFKVDSKFEMDITPTFRVKCFRAVGPLIGSLVSLDFSETDVVNERLSLSGQINWSHDFKAVHVPLFELGIPFLWLYTELGAFLKAGAEVSFDHHWQQTYRYSIHYEACSSELFFPRVSVHGIRLDNSHEGEGVIKGEVGGGFYGELGIEFLDKNIASFGLRGEVGIKLEGDAMIYKKEAETALHSTELYKKLQGSNISLKGFYDIGLPLKIVRLGWDIGLKHGEKEFWKVGIVPDFKNTKLVRDNTDRSMLDASASVIGNCMKSDLGFTLFEQNKDEDGKTGYSAYDYKGPSAEMYSIFFNQSQSKKYEVYPTVKLMNVEMLAEPMAKEGDTFCPDENHPHMIDLGLPSGTKWACCNVGASSPEGYGGYYAWGETEEKSEYRPSTYLDSILDYNEGWWEDGLNGHLYRGQYIGSDIAGTQYDVAHVKWNGDWHMPTRTQIEELFNNTISKWIYQNGVMGRKFTGSNGCTIFFPAAGHRYYLELRDAGIQGIYWSSTLDEDYEYGAYGFDVYSDGAGWSGNHRYYGFTVRPVQ